MLVASALLALIVGGGFAAVLREMGELRVADRLARRSAEVSASANRLESLVIDMQTGSRGFVIARDASFLKPWLNARRSFPGEAGKLRALIVDGAQRRRAEAIFSAVERYGDGFAALLIELGRQDPARARALVIAGSGKRQVDGCARCSRPSGRWRRPSPGIETGAPSPRSGARLPSAPSGSSAQSS